MSALPPHVVDNPRLGTWLSVADTADGPGVEVHVGKVELGQGILTALAQVAADALALPVAGIRMVPADTAHGPDEGLTAGSLSVLQAGAALRHVGAVVRAMADPAEEGYVGRIAALDPDTDLCTAPTAGPVRPTAVGLDVPRLDLPDKVLGRPRFLADLRPEGLLHGRVLRPPSPGARLVSLAPDWQAPGVALVRDGSFVGVVGEREADVDRALEQLARDCSWAEVDSLPEESGMVEWLRAGPHEAIEVLEESPAPGTVTASYSKPLLAHASIAPSVGMALWDSARVRVWSHSQGIHLLRLAIAGALALDPAAIEVEHAENAGCYGHNAADDAAFDAVLLARAVPGRPVQARWTRPDELCWAPLSPAMAATVSAGLVEGRITGWSYDVVGLGHSSRPGYRGAPGLLAAAHLATPIDLPQPTDPPLASGGGTTRNAVPLYDVGPRRVTGHRRMDSPFRTSAMRALGAYLNVFAIESFMDELALAAGADPVDFRLEHLSDERARHVVAEAARLAGWTEPLPEAAGRGLGFARYKDTGAYCAVVAEVTAISAVEVRRLTVVADIGLVVNPDGARNQLEGGATQSVSWTTKERVRFDRRRITTTDWERYPILTFSEAPPVDVHLVDSDEPSLGAGEAAQGPTAAAIANAVHRAIGVRVRDLPLDADSIIRAIEASERQEQTPE
ncbi:xanthine dehydrogenase family protein molybdopterin-binding subunit [Nocardioides marmotae]|uniref:Molybdopterin-dependent oxidoreductase n=1 Tax=Nocardioides marmotae TaxID=2663857 RepID=A0A6I3JF66_9ACTN|nr:molybdopterin cofactor-binding domain-containing protein [Nocardioides marmotae]MCR6033100.1 molybdopterin-dependent oxidoreductase [Gordonia jinghuaiqii]MBC9732601.1 xanthine dehydrogenase family protein molybdopterin-binding subunit [Nocardioides marmotae]MTB83719.1 molybdopterin-dependent oxidoreductase [Nocardioides marmotae]MTB96752.1 molybdopterin-dependent oxidoreductase [Nocardioides marmotae]QKE03039.1 xanthine dehydrogenase family protein molybdopterin-binding subunit [Nocardioide